MKTKTPAEILHDSRKASTSGTDLLTMGLSVGAIGVVGAAFGAVCPVCVVATPALLGLGTLQKLRSVWLNRSTQRKAEPMTHHRQLVSDGALLLDVRTQAEFREGHVPHALNIPVQELPHRLSEVGPTKRPVVVYCRSGGRSAQAAALLKQAGYEVRDIGPMSAW
jgi:rhodanese-related sulfurtransferase